ncbi:MAG: LssY C-terminal domain-containing protein [Acidobacteria bacterium]|nr:LssY C-terminal domain-containing protein [Acidobacteriota bacterium]
MLSLQALLLMLIAASLAFARTQAPSLSVRLKTTLTSYRSREGSSFLGVVTAPYCDRGKVVIPAGSTVYGAVRRVQSVGLGIVRERATLDLDFNSYELPDGRRFPFAGVLARVDNSREEVTAKGEVKGILAANGPQSLVGGIWHWPNFETMPRSFFGMTGLGGRIATAYSVGPAGVAGLFIARCALLRMPEPEIRMPAGTDVRVRVTSLPPLAPTFEPPEERPLPDALSEWLGAQAFDVQRANGAGAADVINVAFVGGRADLMRAFRVAGWQQAEPLTKWSFARAYNAYSAQRGYSTAPVSKLTYRGDEPHVVFQKSYNTISKRHHIRVWESEDGDREVWLAAATHDVGVEFKRGIRVTHRISPYVDAERSKVVNDLAFGGCVDHVSYLDRPEARSESGIHTDGKLAVVFLRNGCEETEYPSMEMPNPPHARLARIVRRMVLEGRQYVLRGNAYYWSYRMIALPWTQRQMAWIEE